MLYSSHSFLHARPQQYPSSTSPSHSSGTESRFLLATTFATGLRPQKGHEVGIQHSIEARSVMVSSISRTIPASPPRALPPDYHHYVRSLLHKRWIRTCMVILGMCYVEAWLVSSKNYCEFGLSWWPCFRDCAGWWGMLGLGRGLCGVWRMGLTDMVVLWSIFTAAPAKAFVLWLATVPVLVMRIQLIHSEYLTPVGGGG